jgi:hypothetical protein
MEQRLQLGDSTLDVPILDEPEINDDGCKASLWVLAKALLLPHIRNPRPTLPPAQVCLSNTIMQQCVLENIVDDPLGAVDKAVRCGCSRF